MTTQNFRNLKKITTYFENGNVEFEFFIDCESIDLDKEGLYQSFYESGQLRSKGNYLNGKLEGEFTVFHENGRIKRKGFYASGEYSGRIREYFENGSKKVIANYRYGKLDAKKLIFDKKGRLVEKSYYFEGMLFGDCERYRFLEDGSSVKETGKFEYGKKHGEFKFFEYKKGEYVLVDIHYYRNDRRMDIESDGSELEVDSIEEKIEFMKGYLEYVEICERNPSYKSKLLSRISK